MSGGERAAFLALLLATPRGWAAVAEQIEELGSAEAVLAERGPTQESLFPGDSDDGSRVTEAASLINQWEQEGMHFATLLDDEYPPQLLTIHQRPPIVMWRGSPNSKDALGVAIVGTRKPSAAGVARAQGLARELTERGVVVISGLAAGIDSAAHLGALEAGGRTVAVIGTGLRRNYPAANAALQRRISHEGMVVSQFLPDAPPTKQSFPMRNAVMSGFSAATVVIEAAAQSGARMQARLALEHGRPVFLLRSLLETEWARDYAQRPGATVVDTVDDVITLLEAASARSGELSWA